MHRKLLDNLRYKYAGRDTRQVCGADGMWGRAIKMRPQSNLLATCVIWGTKCNGCTSMGGDCDSENALEGTLCDVKCNAMHDVASGDARRICGSDGLWSGDPLKCKKRIVPRCTRDLTPNAAERHVETSGSCSEASSDAAHVEKCIQKCSDITNELKEISASAHLTGWTGNDLFCEYQVGCSDPLEFCY